MKESREPCRAMERGENITAMRTRTRLRERERESCPQLLLAWSMQVPLLASLLTVPNNHDKLVETVLFLTSPASFLADALPLGYF